MADKHQHEILTNEVFYGIRGSGLGG